MFWIFGKPHKDILALYGGGFLALLVFSGVSDSHVIFSITAFIITTFVDAGHGYVTLCRAFRNPKSRNFNRNVIILVSIALISLLWIYFKIPYFWRFVVYFTLFHHIRQFYGFSKWYQTMNNQLCRWSDFFLYALLILPVVTFHFRSDISFSIYESQEILFWPSLTLFKVSLTFFVSTLVCWLIYEVHRWKKGFKEINRILSIAVPTFLQSYCFIFADKSSTVILPLLAVHGVAYFFITGYSLNKLNTNISNLWLKTLILIAVVAVVGGSFDHIAEQYVVFDYINSNLHILQVIAIIAITTPALWHYVLDGLIWSKTDSDFKHIRS